MRQINSYIPSSIVNLKSNLAKTTTHLTHGIVRYFPNEKTKDDSNITSDLVTLITR